MNATTLIYTVN